MKFYTKEWYELCQKCGYHLLLKINNNAEAFSDEYYQKLYQRKLYTFLNMEKEISAMSADDVFGAETADPNFIVRVENDRLTPEEQTKVAEDIKKQILKAREAYSPKAYDEATLTEQFQVNHENRIALLKKDLPSKILDMVADIRILALDVASKKVKREIRTWCRANRKQIEIPPKAYRNYLSKNAKCIGLDIVDKFSFHDSKIVSTHMTGSDFEITLDPSGYTEVNTIIFRNSKIIEQNSDLTGAWWLYEEIYPADGGNEYHILVQCANGRPAYLTVFAADVDFNTNVKPEHRV